MSFTVYPAIDVRAGCVVRLKQGDYNRETRFSDGPYQLAMRYADAGAQWLHLVDLDAARHGRYTLHPLLRQIAEDGRLRVQTGGGVRNQSMLEDIFAAGASRVVVGSLAVNSQATVMDWLDVYGAERITIAIDARLDEGGVWKLPVQGWTADTSVELFDCLERYRLRGVRHLLCTDIARDGMLEGPNHELYRALVSRGDELLLQASGGVRDAQDIAVIRKTGCAGVVLGRSLLEGGLTLEDALTC